MDCFPSAFLCNTEPRYTFAAPFEVDGRTRDFADGGLP